MMTTQIRQDTGEKFSDLPVIVYRAGGRISIANRPGGGLVQIVELPEVKEPEAV